MPPTETTDGRKQLNPTQLRMDAEEWAYAVSRLGGEEAQRRQWIAGDWQHAWWARRDGAAVWRMLYGDEADVVVRWQGRGPGAVWLCRGPDGGLRWYCAASMPGGPEVTDRYAVRDLAAKRGEAWLWWFHVYEGIKVKKDWTIAVLGDPGVVTWGADGEATIGPITRTAKGVVQAVLGPDGDDVEARSGKRSWAFSARWREAALALIAAGSVQHKSAMSAQYHVLHQRNRMVKAGELQPWPNE